MSSFAERQRAFADYLRNPDSIAPPGAHEDRRLAIYRNAIFHNAAGLIGDNYPRVKAVLDDAAWETLVREYLVQHRATSSAFVDVPLDFLVYLERERDVPQDPPWLYELAHFDWLETLVGADTRDLPELESTANADPITNVPVANPLLRRVVYRWPVHSIDADHQPTTAPPASTVIAAFRDAGHHYGFIDLNPAAAALLGVVCEQPGRTGAEAVEVIAQQLGRADVGELIGYARPIFVRLLNCGALLGVLAN